MGEERGFLHDITTVDRSPALCFNNESKIDEKFDPRDNPTEARAGTIWTTIGVAEEEGPLVQIQLSKGEEYEAIEGGMVKRKGIILEMEEIKDDTGRVYD